MQVTQESLVKLGSIDQTLIDAVIDQFGGWDEFVESAPDVCQYGIDGGFGNFIYYHDTCAFFVQHRRAIVRFAREMADDLGDGLLEMIQGFNCVGKEYTIDEIGETIFGDNDNDIIQNAMTWFVAEEVCRLYCDLLEE
jgi:hypothetical protein